MSSRIDDLLGDGSAFTLEKFRDERAALEERFALEYKISAYDIKLAVNRGHVPCSSKLVQEWVALMALWPYVDPDGWEAWAREQLGGTP